MTSENLEARLLQVTAPHQIPNWTEDFDYVQACKLSDKDIPELDALMRTWIDEGDYIDEGNDYGDDVGLEIENVDSPETRRSLLPMTAWRALDQLGSKLPSQFLFKILFEQEEPDIDDFAPQDCAIIIGKEAPEYRHELIDIVRNDELSSFQQGIAVATLGKIGRYHAGIRTEVCESLLSLVSAENETEAKEKNAFIALALGELQCEEYSLKLEELFSKDAIDVSITGQWTCFATSHNLKSTGLPMPEKPYNSISMLDGEIYSGRQWMHSDDSQVESFEERLHDEIEQICEDFYSKCDTRLKSESPGTRYLPVFLEYAFFQEEASLFELNVADLDEVLFQWMPRRFTVEPEAAGRIVKELTIFFEEMSAKYDITNHKAILKHLRDKELPSNLRDALADESTYGLAKSIATSANNLGYDISDPVQADEFLDIYNQKILADRKLENESSDSSSFSRIDSEHQPQPPAPIGPTLSPEARRKYNKNRKKELERRTRK